jgi:hypothetical protein
MCLISKKNGDSSTSQQPVKSRADIHKDLLNCLEIAYQYIPQVESEKDTLEHLRAMIQTSQKRIRRSAQFPQFARLPSEIQFMIWKETAKLPQDPQILMLMLLHSCLCLISVSCSVSIERHEKRS